MQFKEVEPAAKARAGDVDLRPHALRLMTMALSQLDSDRNIPLFIGAHLQSAIDALWANVSNGAHSDNFH